MGINRDKYLRTYRGKELLKKYNFELEGTWHVKGEDPNCDMRGSHHEPSLGYYNGILHQVIDITVELPGFWQWGAGGSIIKVNVNNIDSKEFKRQEEVRVRIKEVEKQLAQLTDELNGV